VGDWKSEMMLFVAQDDLSARVNLPMTDLFGQLCEMAVARADPEMLFNSYSNDHMLFLDGFLAAYPPPVMLPRITEGPDICLRFIAHGECAALATGIIAWESAFLADPAPVLNCVRQGYVGVFKGPPAGVDAALMLALYEGADTQGVHTRMDSACHNLMDAVDTHGNLMDCSCQTFGYLKALRGWLQAADARGMGLVCMTY
jgi:hypothetical protein